MNRWIFAVVATLVAATVLPSCGSGDGETDADAPRSASAFPHSLRSSFALFRADSGPRDELPENLLLPGEEARFRIRAYNSRLAYTAPFGRYYVLPSARGLVCMVGTDRVASNCWPTRTVAAGTAAATSMCSYGLPPRTLEMFGLVPDGVRTVTLLYSDGSRRTAAVDRNAFVIRFPYSKSLPTRVQWIRGGESHRGIAGILPSAARKACAP